MSDLLFVCTANICRSAYAEVMARALAPTLVTESAGIQGWINKAMDRPIAAVAAARGGDPSGFRSRRLQLPMVRDARLVLTAEVKHRVAILEDLPAARSKVFTLGQFAAAVQHAPTDLRGDELIGWVGDLRQQSDARLDVSDPYRRGPDAAVEAADLIDSHLAVILPRL